MKTYLFPEQVTCRTLPYEDAFTLFKVPVDLDLTVHQQPVFKDNKLLLKAELRNHGGDFSLVVHPYGGRFPYGGTSPFRISFSPSGENIVQYIGPVSLPEPPLPMVITIPAKSTIIFTAEIPIEFYDWQGEPEVVIDWAFYYLKEPYPKGSLKIILPKNQK